MVKDLRPVLRLKKIKAGSFGGLTFRDTPATAQDSELVRLAEISDSAARGRRTLAYLATLPIWPEPYIPNARPDVQTAK